MTLVLAWFLILVVSDQDAPVLRGPFLSQQDCWAELEYFEAQGMTTGGCSELSLPQETDTRSFDGEPYVPVDTRRGP